MGLESDEEAYLATQLAIYEIVSRRGLVDIATGSFSLDKVVASEEVYEEMVSRIVAKAKELADNAINNPYDNNYYTGIVYRDNFQYIYDDETQTGKYGPLYSYCDLTEEVLRVLPEDYVPKTYFNLKNFLPESSQVSIIDSNENEIDSIPVNEDFYIRVKGENKYFINIKISRNAENLLSKVYYNNTSKKKYVVLDTYERNHTSIVSWTNIDNYGKIILNFTDVSGERLYGAKYYILNEQREVVWDVNGFPLKTIRLPLGKYYIQEYEAPDDYLINLNEYEVELKDNEEEVTVTIVHDSLF